MYEYKCKIIKVIDGDTTDVDIDLGFGVWLKKQRIRFFGIDTPESRTRDLEEKKYGLAAKKYVTDRMPVGSKPKHLSLLKMVRVSMVEYLDSLEWKMVVFLMRI